jgi:hypothetical protein
MAQIDFRKSLSRGRLAEVPAARPPFGYLLSFLWEALCIGNMYEIGEKCRIVEMTVMPFGSQSEFKVRAEKPLPPVFGIPRFDLEPYLHLQLPSHHLCFHPSSSMPL